LNTYFLNSHCIFTENTAEVILKNKLGTFTSQKTSAIESLGAEFFTVNKKAFLLLLIIKDFKENFSFK